MHPVLRDVSPALCTWASLKASCVRARLPLRVRHLPLLLCGPVSNDYYPRKKMWNDPWKVPCSENQPGMMLEYCFAFTGHPCLRVKVCCLLLRCPLLFYVVCSGLCPCFSLRLLGVTRFFGARRPPPCRAAVLSSHSLVERKSGKHGTTVEGGVQNLFRATRAPGAGTLCSWAFEETNVRGVLGNSYRRAPDSAWPSPSYPRSRSGLG